MNQIPSAAYYKKFLEEVQETYDLPLTGAEPLKEVLQHMKFQQEVIDANDMQILNLNEVAK